jgi:hypothetical protein
MTTAEVHTGNEVDTVDTSDTAMQLEASRRFSTTGQSTSFCEDDDDDDWISSQSQSQIFLSLSTRVNTRHLAAHAQRGCYVTHLACSSHMRRWNKVCLGKQ